MKSAKVNTNSEQEVKTEQAEQLSIDTVDEVALAISNSRFSSLKSKELAAVGLQLDANKGKTFEIVRERCKLYGEILKRDLWKADGYKNFKECADKLFGDNKGIAYMQAAVGSRFYADDASDIAAELGKYLPYSILDKLNKMNDTELAAHKADILKTDSDGNVIGAITQKDADDLCKRVLAERAKSGKSGESGESGEGGESGESKTQVVPMYNFIGYRVLYIKEDAVATPVKLENVAENTAVSELTGETKDHTFKFSDKAYTVTINETGEVVVAVKSKYVKPAESKPSMDVKTYDGIKAARRAGLPVETVAVVLGIGADVVQRVYDALDRETEVLKARAEQAEQPEQAEG